MCEAAGRQRHKGAACGAVSRGACDVRELAELTSHARGGEKKAK